MVPSHRHLGTLFLSSLIPTLVFADDSTSSTTPFSIGMAVDQQLSVVIQYDDKVNFIVGNEGAAIDYFLKRGRLTDEHPIDWYVGAGIWGEWDDDFGVRVPLGAEWNFYDGWDTYAQIQPELNMHKGWELGIGAAIGIKYKF